MAKEDKNSIPVSGHLEPLCVKELSDKAVGNGGGEVRLRLRVTPDA